MVVKPTRAQNEAAKVAKMSAAFMRKRQQDAALAALPFDSATWTAIDNYRAAQPNHPSRIVALSRLVLLGLGVAADAHKGRLAREQKQIGDGK